MNDPRTDGTGRIPEVERSDRSPEVYVGRIPEVERSRTGVDLRPAWGNWPDPQTTTVARLMEMLRTGSISRDEVIVRLGLDRPVINHSAQEDEVVMAQAIRNTLRLDGNHPDMLFRYRFSYPVVITNEVEFWRTTLGVAMRMGHSSINPGLEDFIVQVGHRLNHLRGQGGSNTFETYGLGPGGVTRQRAISDEVDQSLRQDGVSQGGRSRYSILRGEDGVL